MADDLLVLVFEQGMFAMFHWFLRTLVGAACMGLVSGCATHYDTHRAAVAYNKAFADARNEVLLLNILRAWAREPLQFSTTNQVVGPLNNSTSIKIPFSNIILGGAEAINPELTVGVRNPNVTITSLESQQFVQGILRPVAAETLDQLIAQGWHRPTVLAMTIAGVECPTSGSDAGEDVRLNLGPPLPLDAEFQSIFRNSDKFTLQHPGGAEIASFTVNASDRWSCCGRAPDRGETLRSSSRTTQASGSQRVRFDLRSAAARRRGSPASISPACATPMGASMV